MAGSALAYLAAELPGVPVMCRGAHYIAFETRECPSGLKGPIGLWIRYHRIAIDADRRGLIEMDVQNMAPRKHPMQNAVHEPCMQATRQCG